jgi:hypothetical protein
MNICKIVNRKIWELFIEDFRYFGLCQIFVLITFFYNPLTCAVGINDLSPELKDGLKNPELKSKVQNFLNENSESRVEGFGTKIPIWG